MANYKRKDHLFNRAKEEGYRSRAAYKLGEIQKQVRLISRGDTVLDLGAWPGGWLQVASTLVGVSGRVVGVDLRPIEDFSGPNIKCIVGDVRDSGTIDAAREFVGGKFSVVISDLSPKLTGIREVDAAAVESLAYSTLDTVRNVLAEHGNFAIKLFKGNEASQFVKVVRPMFDKARSLELDATRSTSNEFYLVGLGFRVTVNF